MMRMVPLWIALLILSERPRLRRWVWTHPPTMRTRTALFGIGFLGSPCPVYILRLAVALVCALGLLHGTSVIARPTAGSLVLVPVGLSLMVVLLPSWGLIVSESQIEVVRHVFYIACQLSMCLGACFGVVFGYRALSDMS